MDLIKKQGGKVVGGQLVTDVTVDSAAGAVSGVYTSTRDGKKTYYAADAVIFAVGITGECFVCWFQHCLMASVLNIVCVWQVCSDR